MKHILLTLCLATPALSETCATPPDIEANMDALFEEIAETQSQFEARPLNDALWTLWLQAPDPYSQNLLDSSMERMRAGDYGGAEKGLTELVRYCPWYAEGWNQRAFTYYLTGRYEKTLTDLDEALKINPRHLGVLTGKALTLIAMGRTEDAQPVLREALELNPWLSERALLTGEEL